jgi:hypothetical protein
MDVFFLFHFFGQLICKLPYFDACQTNMTPEVSRDQLFHVRINEKLLENGVISLLTP